jgi:uncharacterized protein
VRERLRAALPGAPKQRDRALVAVLRATLAALDNAEPVAPTDDQESLGVREVAHRELSDEDMELLVRAEIDERQTAARVYEQAGEHEHARRLRQEADTLTAVAGLGRASGRAHGWPTAENRARFYESRYDREQREGPGEAVRA